MPLKLNVTWIKKMIVDLHCDLLLFLAGDPQRSAYDPISRCSIPQMRSGTVRLQILPIYTETTADSVEKGLQQNAIFHSLSHQYPNDYVNLEAAETVFPHPQKISIVRAIENASSFCSEAEPLNDGLNRLKQLSSEGPLIYLGLTWNSENRFGGGAATAIGLKPDGKQLLDFMHGRNMAVDLSHTSDHLAYDILDYIDTHNLQIPVLASHSNCRSVTNVPRNLPDNLVQEIIRRNGIIGLNFVKPFLGTSGIESLNQQLDCFLRLGGENHVCFGADFFFEEDIPLHSRRGAGEYFYEDFGNSAVYGRVLETWKSRGISRAILENIAHETAYKFIKPLLPFALPLKDTLELHPAD